MNQSAQQLELETQDYKKARFRVKWHLGHRPLLHPINFDGEQRSLFECLIDVRLQNDRGRRFVRQVGQVAM